MCSTPSSPRPAWDSLMDEGWQSLITLSGTDWDPTCFLLAHIRVTLLMNYNSTQRGHPAGGHSVSVYTPCYSLYIELRQLIHHGDNVLSRFFSFSSLVADIFSLLKKKKKKKRHDELAARLQSCRNISLSNTHTHTYTHRHADTFLFLYDVWRHLLTSILRA